MNPKVDEFLDNATKWQREMRLLRSIALSCNLVEELKWGTPCYTFNGKNVLIIGGFKEYFVLSFLKGVLIKDEYKILSLPGENSQAVRWAKFTSIDEMIKIESILRAYIFEAIEIEKSGIKLPERENQELVFVDELAEVMEKNPAFKSAFESLTPGRQRAYNMFFSAAKQAKSRKDRIEKFTPRILKGFGMNDCVCGHSKRYPNCDGSHKNFEGSKNI